MMIVIKTDETIDGMNRLFLDKEINSSAPRRPTYEEKGKGPMYPHNPLCDENHRLEEVSNEDDDIYYSPPGPPLYENLEFFSNNDDFDDQRQPTLLCNMF